MCQQRRLSWPAHGGERGGGADDTVGGGAPPLSARCAGVPPLLGTPGTPRLLTVPKPLEVSLMSPGDSMVAPRTLVGLQGNAFGREVWTEWAPELCGVRRKHFARCWKQWWRS